MGGIRRGAGIGILALVLLAVGITGTAAAAPPPPTAPSPAGVQELAGQVVIPAGTTMTGDIRMLAGQVTVDGTLQGTVSLTAGQVDVGPQGRVQGTVTVAVGQVDVRPGGRVTGTVRVGGSTSAQGISCPATSAADCTLTGASGSVSGGVHRAVAWRALRRAVHIPAWVRGGIHVLGWLGTLALALPVVALFPQALGVVSRQVETDLGRSALLGLVVLVLALPVLLLVSITIIGIPVALAAGLVLVAAWFFGYVAVAVLLGTRTLRLGGAADPNPLLALLIGSVLIGAAEWVPWAGGLVRLAIGCVGVGAVVLTRFGTGSDWPRRAG